MDEIVSGIDPDDLMDLDEAEGSDLDEEEDELIDDPLPSPFPFTSSGPGSTATSVASSPPNNDDFPTPFNFSGKPLSIKRGRGRPRREGGKPAQRRPSTGNRIKKLKLPGYPRTAARKLKNFDRLDFDLSCITPSPSDELSMLDPDTGALIFTEREKPFPVVEELPYFPEQWPGKVCAFCNLGEKSQLGQGEMLRLICPEGFIPQRIAIDPIETSTSNIPTPERESGDKSPRGPVTCRRQKSFNKCRHPSLTSEYVDELTIIGYIEEPHVSSLFDASGYFFIHRSCASWSNGVTKNENSALENVGPAVLQSSSKKCSFCNHYGASISCRVEGCTKVYHFPCATASGAFQVLNSLALYCCNHIGQASLECEFAVCYTCKSLGDIANLMYCSSCGEHYHGICVGLAQLPGVRAGWQCRKCRICQVCRMTGDETKLMTCEQCDKVYHSTCQRPIVTSIPKYGWKCRCCRVCGDCGSRTPGAGLSSRWHAHYTVCDSCYQQRNKGFSCPLCRRAYRAHAHREMVQCTSCRKFVHGTCDAEADLVTYHQRKETHPEYEYVCLMCKNSSQPGSLTSKRSSTDDPNECLSLSQDSTYDDSTEFDPPYPVDPFRIMGLGKGKPYSASKIAKKRLGLVGVIPGRPKGIGKGLPGKVGFMKRQRMTEFGRKRGPKTKMRGVFGAPGVGLQRPVSDGKNDDEPGLENRLVLCSAKDKFVLTQDICVMCGALGTDQEGCLISCVQCGQCYHPYCVSVKVTKVILQKGWRCLDCTVCEGCGQRHDEGRLILCDDCDISYHIYCMDPPLDYVPHGNWKCKWCAICQTCGATDPGFNCTWMNSFNECGPCASHVNCPSCSEPYSEGDLIIQCVQCERWLHGACDAIKTEEEAEKCAEEGYNCLLCRPRDVPPPHLIPSANALKPPTPTKSPEVKSNNNYLLDGVYLSESGHNLIKSLSLEQHGTRKKRKKIATVQDKEAGIMATIESVVAGGNAANMLDDSAKLELVDVKDEPTEIYKEGMIWTKDDGPPPEGFTIFTMENGVSVLRRKRQRNLQKLGIGGFIVRMRGIRSGQDNDDIDVLPGQSTPTGSELTVPLSVDADKPRRKPVRRKPKSKLAETFPPYLQEAFFGKELLDSTKELDSSSSDEEKHYGDMDKTIQLTQDEIKAVAAVSAKHELGESSLLENKDILEKNLAQKLPIVAKEEEEEENTEDLKDVLLSTALLDNDLVNTIMNEGGGELAKTTESLDALTGSNLTDETDIAETLGTATTSKDTKDELSDILGSHFNLPNMDSKDVEDIFKGVLTDDSQESQESNAFPIQNNNAFAAANTSQTLTQHPVVPAPVRPTTLPAVNQSSMNSPLNFPPQSPYQSEYSNSPQFSPAFSEPPSPWVSVNDANELDTPPAGVPTYNQRSSEKMKADESLGNGATISAVLYANINHADWKTEFPNWSDRYKQILKKWRTLNSEQKAPYLQQARDNRSALRMKKQQQSQMNKETTSSSTVTKAAPIAAVAATPAVSIPSTQVPAIVAPVSEVCTQQSRPTPSLTTASTSSVSVSPPITTPIRPSSLLTPSPSTQQQFTVHGQFPGPGDHCGPAPNVTVNPLYQPNANEQVPNVPLLRPNIQQQTPPPPASDQQIRVLTPSEIMRTLPSLCQENYEPQPPDQEKVALQHKSAREAEQERQWKQLQALRQQQAQQQQHVILEQRVQAIFPAIARVQRQISDPTQPYVQEQNPQELSPVTSPAPNARQLLTMGIKSPTFTHPNQPSMRPALASQTALEFPTLNNTPDSDPYAKPPSTPKPLQATFQPRLPADPYAQQPSTPRPQFPIPRPTLQGINAGVRTPEGPEMNRQLRDLLQRQQFKKLDDQILPGKGQQRVWPIADSSNQEGEATAAATATAVNLPTSSDATFRHPLPPARPRMPMPVPNVLRQPGALLGLRMQQLDPRIQGLDPRTRLLFQQQQQRLIQANTAPNQTQGFGGGTVRFAPGAVRPASVEQYEQVLQRQQATPFQPRGADSQITPRLPVSQLANLQRPIINQAAANSTTTCGNENTNSEQEIPDNVTAELEKLEQESGTMVELQGVGDILGGLGDDDDELLAEMGADFNILEYADPEALPGEKTNILDLELEEEPIKNDKKVKVEIPKTSATVTQPNPSQIIKKEAVAPPPVISASQNLSNIHPPPLAMSQAQVGHPPTVGTPTHLTPQQIHQQMMHQVQQAAAQGRPMPPGSKLQTPDGIIGIVTPNNGIHLQIPQSYHQRFVVSQMHNQKLQMRVGQNVPRMMSSAPVQQALHANAAGLNAAPRLAGPPPPPPPYPGPPPPYPGSATVQQQQQQQQMGLRMGPVHLPLGHIHPMRLQGLPLHPHLQRRPLLLEISSSNEDFHLSDEQPLLLEDLLEQEKREQEKQNQTSVNNPEISSSTSSNTVEGESPALLSDHDFERLKADVFSGSSIGIHPNARPNQVISNTPQSIWPQNQNRPTPTPTPQPTNEIRVQTFNVNLLPPPPLPPENIATEQDKQKQILYEQWLNNQNKILSQQLGYYETEVAKLRKHRKALNSKQRQLRKTGNQLTETDASELQRISAEQSIIQKHLEASRKLTRQHGLLIQEYRNKQQAKQRPGPGQSPLLMQQNHSPLGPPSSSPIHHSNTSQSPMMSPSASPLTQHSSPMHSPSPMIPHSPGPGSVSNILQSPNSITGNNMSPMQPSPRIGTPHSQGDGSPVPSPSQICLPPPAAPRMTSPQHKRVVTSPVGYTGDLRPGTPQMRFVRTPIDHVTALQQRTTRLPSPLMGFQQKPGTPSPLSSPPPQQMNISQQLIQKQLQQNLLQQQSLENQDANVMNSQRAAQLIQQRNFVRQQIAAQQQQQQQGIAQPQPLTPQQHQMMVQQQQQLAKQQQQQIQAQLQAQQRLNQQQQQQQQSNPPTSPMPPKSPLISQQIMSPHSMPASPMPPRSPMMSYGNNQQTPNSPVARTANFHQSMNQPPSSPMTHNQYQPPSSPMPRSPMVSQMHSPMGMRRPPSANSSPAMPDRPTSVENPGHPRTPYSSQNSLDNSTLMDNQGGGNPMNNPIPAPPGFGRFGSFKLGLRGGSPMWGFARGAKRIPTASGSNKDLDPNAGETSGTPTVKPKKESHLSKVSILKRKSPAKTNLQSLAISKVGSLVSTDYNEFDDSSCTPPVTPPPLASTSRITIHKTIGKKIPEQPEPNKEPANPVMIVHSPEEKQIRCDDIIDYDDDNNTVISGEVSLSSAAQQNDGDDIAVIETFSQSDIGEAMSSPLESDQIADEYLLFPGNMVVDITGETQYSDKEEAEEEYSSENMHVLIRSPTTSDDEFISQNKPKKFNIHRLPSNHVLGVTEASDSPEQEDLQVDPSPDGGDEENYEESEIVIIDPSIKSPEEQISTKEDFEELIDEDTRKEKIMKQDIIAAKHIKEIHKYAANVYNFPSKSELETVGTVTNTNRVANLITSKLGQKISLMSTTVVHNIATVSRADVSKINSDVGVTQNSKLVTTSGSKLTNIIFHNAVRSNVLSVPKLVTSSSAITIVNANTSPIASILPSGFTVPVLSASAVRQLPNVKVIDKPSSSISLTTHDSCLPKKIFEDDSVSPDSSNCEDDKSKDSSDEKSKSDSPPGDFTKQPTFTKSNDSLRIVKDGVSENIVMEKIKSPPVTCESVVSTDDNDKQTKNDSQTRKVETIQVTSVKVQNPVKREPSPVISKTSTPVIIHNTPELKMTAQIIEESQSGMQITARTETTDGFEGNSGDDTKSVVISIPSPTPSQEQMLDNIALQALENRRRDGNGIPGEFESFEDVLDMIENITGEPPTVLEDNIKDKLMNDEITKKTDATEKEPTKDNTSVAKPETPIPVTTTVTANTKPSVVPQLSPLSQPTELTTNMANASQQLRTLLSSLHTTAATSSNNIETVAKSVSQKVVSTGSIQSTPVITPRVVQQQQQTAVTSLSTVIVPNMKSKPITVSVASPIRTQTVSIPQSVANVLTSIANSTNLQIATSGLNFLPARSLSGGIHLMPDHPKLPRVTGISTNVLSVSTQPSNISVTQPQQQPLNVTTATSSVENSDTVNRKPTYSLTEMLQSHPAAVPTTKTSADTITAASLLGTSIGLARTGFTTSLVQAQPHVVVSPAASTNLVLQTTAFMGLTSTSSVTTSSVFKPVTTTTNLLHTQLTKVMRSKSLEESISEFTKHEEIKSEPIDPPTDDNNKPNIITSIKQEFTGCKFSSIQTTATSRTEDSQNVLLKKLLQNTACASTQTPVPASVAAAITVAAPIQFTASNLVDSQLKVNTPTLSSILPPVVKEAPPAVSLAQVKVPPQRTPIMTRETSFVSSPVVQQPQQQQQPQTSTATMPTQQLHIDIKKCMPPSRTPSRDDLLSPPTPRSSCSQDSSLQTPPLVVKKEMNQQQFQQQTVMMTAHEVKKEFVDETSQHSEVSDHSRSDVQMKEEIDGLDSVTEKMLLDQKEELKKQKRRMYQQKRRQNQILNKETVGQPKKRPRKSSKVDEDYDTYIDGVLAQLRTLPPMVVSEPVLNRNFSILPVFGSDLSKLASNDYDSRFGDLVGDYGNAVVPGYSDFYSTQPYGDEQPLPEKPPASTQRGFYDQEFPLIKFDNDEDKRFDLFCREDSPDSIISSSSPECPLIEPPHKFLGLKLIDEDDEDEEEDTSKMRLSPVVPIIAPIPIRLKPTGPYLKDYADDKENIGRDMCLKSKFGSTPPAPLKDSGNVTVTLTLTSSAAEDIMGVLRDLANILHIPAPTSYQIVERTSTPPSQKLGLYRTKGKDGKEGAPIDIQSILNGAAKFCKHCDVVILNNMIRKKVSELPFLSKDSELLSDGDELFFCSTTCYMQFALMHRSPSIPEDKAAAIIDHLCPKDKTDLKAKRPFVETSVEQKHFVGNMEMELHYYKKDVDLAEGSEVKTHSLFTKPSDANKFKKYSDELQSQTTSRVWRGVRYKSWAPGCLQPATKHKKPTDKEIMELLYRLGITVTPPKMPEDIRKCMFCQGIGDGVADGPARLLNFDVDKWVHLNCGLWSDGVYETVNGALMNLENALPQSLIQVCVHCNKLGATIRCFKTRCSNVYHLACAVKDGCVFYKNKTTYCIMHVPKNEKDNELTTLSVSRRVYVNRDENRQVAAVMHHSDTSNLLRVGSLIFLNVGQLLPHQLLNFHTPNFIYPIGYKIIRFYWSMRYLNKRCKYICSIYEVLGRPQFRVVVQEPPEEDLEFTDVSPKSVWQRILEQISTMRRENQCVQFFPKFVSGEDLFGLTEPAVVRVLESLPGIETLTDYKFKYGRNPLLELPLAINPSGAARTEPRLRNQLHWKRPHTQRTGTSSRPLFGPSPSLASSSTLGEAACPYSKQFVHSKSSQYKKMKQEWRNNVYLARSKIQGLGLYAARDLEKHTMVIEYIGEIIRTELAETREKKYEAKNRGIYMFRLDEERVVDATLCGGLARYINHSCNPNCVAETVEVDRDFRIIIFAKRRIQRGEELAYDYKFDIEDDQHKISCMCGAPNCRKWMN